MSGARIGMHVARRAMETTAIVLRTGGGETPVMQMLRDYMLTEVNV